jgi:hypothetical protein
MLKVCFTLWFNCPGRSYYGLEELWLHATSKEGRREKELRVRDRETEAYNIREGKIKGESILEERGEE